MIRACYGDDEEECTQGSGDDDEERFLLQSIGGKAKSEDEDESGSVKRDGVELTGRTFPPERADEGRNKVLNGLCAGTEHVERDKDPCSPVDEYQLNSIPMTNMSCCTLSGSETVVCESLSGKNSFFLREPFRGGWPVREDKPGETAEE